jgi:hypothetical protein
VTPVLVANRTQLQADETFFSVMEPRLLEVEPGANGTPSRAVLRGGQPAWHALDGAHDYLRRLGGNTGYVIHPEEAMADNIALLATGIRARNPELLARLRGVLDGAPSVRARDPERDLGASCPWCTHAMQMSSQRQTQ